VLPERVWRSIGLKPLREHFILADGTVIRRKVQNASPLSQGEVDDHALLGVVMLEILGLILNQFKHILQPMRMLLI
jgi:hypothetical protein